MIISLDGGKAFDKIQHLFPGGPVINNLPAMQDTRLEKIPWRRKWQPTPVILTGKSHGQRSLEGYSPWGWKESDITERLTISLSFPQPLPGLLFLSGMSFCHISVRQTPTYASTPSSCHFFHEALSFSLFPIPHAPQGM